MFYQVRSSEKNCLSFAFLISNQLLAGGDHAVSIIPLSEREKIPTSRLIRVWG